MIAEVLAASPTPVPTPTVHIDAGPWIGFIFVIGICLLIGWVASRNRRRPM